jgi:hypothetical protein
MSDTLKFHIRVDLHLIDKDLVRQVLALRIKQIQVERKHLACSSGHHTLGILNGFLGLLKINLKSSLDGVFGHLGHSFGFLGFSLSFLGFCLRFLGFL